VTWLRRGQVTAAAGINPQTLRYYQRRGLLAEPDRSLGGHRLYPAGTVTVVRVIKTAQRLGFTLDEVADILDATRHCHGRRPKPGLHDRAGEAGRGGGKDRRPASHRRYAARSGRCQLRRLGDLRWQPVLPDPVCRPLCVTGAAVIMYAPKSRHKTEATPATR
jgi:DNA-binding transcriptional MerR regulator